MDGNVVYKPGRQGKWLWSWLEQSISYHCSLPNHFSLFFTTSHFLPFTLFAIYAQQW